ncbi:amino acid adenylation domain-containing protein [Aquimarina sp. 2201CG1-2-11]|uniref:amino acid adenylation domain-containing protein n=1 Tax=Aquimarina discodermiae TaxID=3231043 RepID=UPI003462A398
MNENKIIDIIHQAETNKVQLFVEDGELKFKSQKGYQLDKEVIKTLKENKTNIISFLKKELDQDNEVVPAIERHISPDFIPLSYSQERLWFIDKLQGSLHYHIPGVFRVKGALDISCLESSILKVLSRHESLRTVFGEEDGVGYQKILEVDNFSIRVLDFDSGLGEEGLDALIREDISLPFDLSSDYMLRCSVIELSSSEFILLLVLHHIASDGWSLSILVEEMVGYYNSKLSGEDLLLPPLPVQYSDYSIWQRDYLSDSRLSSKLSYWLDHLSGVSPLLFPTDYARPVVQSTSGSRYVFDISSAVTSGLHSLSRSSDSTLFMVLLSVYKVLLYRYTGQEDICVGTPIANRGQSEVSSLIGFFVNTLALRSHLSGDQSFRSFLSAVREMMMQGYKYQDVPFEKVVDGLDIARDQGRTALFQTMFTLQNNTSISDLQLGDSCVELLDIARDTSKFDFSFTVTEGASGLSVEVEYCTSLFKEDTIIRLCDHFVSLLTSVISTPDESLSRLVMLSDLEREELLLDFNATAVDYPMDSTVLDLFQDQVVSNPDRVALVFEDQEMSYGELDARSNRLAHYLLSQGVGEETLVPICIDRSFDMIIGVLGILKSGGVYVPIDPAYPMDRITFMLKDTDADLVVVDSGKESLFEGMSVTMIVLDDLSEELYHYPDSAPEVDITTDNLAYVIYTSGTTGVPKGVLCEHKGVLNLVLSQIEYMELSEKDNVLQFASIAFDAFGFELYSTILSGGKLILVKNGDLKSKEIVKELILKNNVTVATLPPSYQMILKDILFSIRIVVSAGEALHIPTTKKLQTNGVKVINGYGPTESTVCATMSTKPIYSQTIATIGKPVSNTQIYILNEGLDLQPTGVIGELCIGGIQVARGYLNRPSLSDQKFIANPFIEGDRLYKTGDLARWLPSGDIEFIGRKDNQVKIRGYRIELGEIEASLDGLAGVTQSVVLSLKDPQGSSYLVAYVVSGVTGIDQLTLQDELRNTLPAYMIPGIFVFLNSFPLTHNGKIDRKSLPSPDLSSQLKEYVSPSTETERLLVGIWEDLLGIEGIGITDNFFELGGDSIKAIQLVSRGASKGFHFAVQDIFTYQTVMGLSSNLQVEQRVEKEEGFLSGPLGLLPIQESFFAKGYADADHYNQAVLLTIDKGISSDDLSRAVDLLYTHHDSLRIQFEISGGVVTPRYSPFKGEVIVDQVSSLSDITSLCDYYQGDLSIEKGDLCRFVLLQTPEGELYNRLFIVIHHLGIDGVSWRILLEDLVFLLEGLQDGVVRDLPVKGSSYRQWSSALQEYAQDVVLLEELPYWQGVLSSIVDFPQDTDYKGDSIQGDLVTYQSVLDASDTNLLLQGVSGAYGTEINDLLLSALALTLGDWLDSDRFVIGLEGHGRESLFSHLDITRTIGWFTSLFPVVLDGSGDLSEVISRTKDMLRDLPDKGIGYGVLRYLSESLDVRESLSKDFETIIFNYLGGFDNSFKEDGLLGFSGGSTGDAISRNNRVSNYLSINSLIVDGELRMDWSYDSNRYQGDTIADLSELYMFHLRSILSHCQGIDGRIYTPGDYGLPLSVGWSDLVSFKESSVHKGVVSDLYPLSPLQEGILFHSLYDSTTPAYLVQLSCDLLGSVDLSIFLESWRYLCDRHTILRTGFHSNSLDIAVQCVYEAIDLPIECLDYRSMSSSEQESSLSSILGLHNQEGFVLENAPLWRITLIRLEDTRTRLVFTNHHILWDGWSFPQLMGDFINIYKGLLQGQNISHKDIDAYRDQVFHLKGKNLSKGKEYWQAYLLGLDSPVYLPFSSSNITQEMEMTNTEKIIVLDKELTDDLLSYCQSSRITINTLLQGCWSYLLSKYTGRRDVVFGATVSGRDSSVSSMESRVGLYINTIPVRALLDDEVAIVPWLVALQQGHTTGREEYSYVPLSEIQSDIGITGTLFDSLLVFENYPVDQVILGSENFLEIENVIVDEQIHYTLGILCHTSSSGLSIKFLYNDTILSSSIIDMLQGHLKNVLESIVNGAEYIKDLEYISSTEQDKLLLDFNATAVNYPKDSTVLGLFQDQVESNPDRVALVFGDATMTYGELDSRSNRLAHHLLSQGLGEETLVPICVDRGFDMIVGILGILKSGGAYIPIDPAYPMDRITFMLKDTDADLVVVDSGKESLFEGMNVTGIILDDLSEELYNYPDSVPEVDITLDNLAYVIYTSGSTGTPKGVMIEHGSLYSLLITMSDKYPLREEDRMLLKTTFTFDVSVYELFGWVIGGGSLGILPKGEELDMSRFIGSITSLNVTHLNLVPSLFSIFLKELQFSGIDQVSSLRYILLAGEVLPQSLVAVYHELGLDAFLDNVYGPTEATIYSSSYQTSLLTSRLERVPIGSPLSNVQAYILDDYVSLVPVGVIGELCIGGVQVARGYLNRPSLTDERFIANPFVEGARLYRTGDLARWLPSGDIEFIGRKDNQVKIRGYRIELGEIETSLEALPEVSQALVLSRSDKNGEQRLVSYVIPNLEKLEILDNEEELDISDSHISDWEELWERIYGDEDTLELLTQPDDFNIIGWNSSYTGEAIATAEMKIWRESTVARIQRFSPDKVLEIGCGTGLLLSQIAIDTSLYYGTDISGSSLSYIDQKLVGNLPKKTEIKLFKQEANDFMGLTDNSYDMIILNSVIQYFSGPEYLEEVLIKSLALVQDGGCIFIGDVRSKELLKSFFLDIELFKSEENAFLNQIYERSINNAREEHELVVDPGFFKRLRLANPRISHIELNLKRGDFYNELTRFRYDVILHIGKENVKVSSSDTIDCQKEKINTSQIENLLKSKDLDKFTLKNLTNDRLEDINQTRDIIFGSETPEKKSDLLLKKTLASTNNLINMDIWWDLGEALGYHTTIFLNDKDPRGEYNVVYVKEELMESGIALDNTDNVILDNPLEEYTNLPIFHRLSQKLPSCLKKNLSKKLPEYMIPGLYVILNSFPLNFNGKIDRKALPDPGITDLITQEYVAPVTATEKELTSIWEEVLGINRIGMNDNFFELGGHSLLAIRLLSKINNKFKQEYSILQVFQYPTIKLFSEFLSYGEIGFNSSGLVKISKTISKDKNTIFCAPGAGGNIVSFYTLAEELKECSNIYGFQAYGLDKKSDALKSVEEIAARNIHDMQKVVPNGPYKLAGYSFGSMIVYEMALQLISKGFKVDELIIFDGIPYIDEETPKHLYSQGRESIVKNLISIYDMIMEFSEKKTEETKIYEEGLISKSEEEQIDIIYNKLMLFEVDFFSKEIFKKFINVHSIQTQAMFKFRPDRKEKMNVPISIFIPSETDIELIEKTWSNITSSEVVIREVSGEHLTMLNQPYIVEITKNIMQNFNK